jgi:hypothetical protein
MSSFVAAAFTAAMVGGLVHLGLAEVPSVTAAQDAASCRTQRDLPGIEAGRQLHCSRVLP